MAKLDEMGCAGSGATIGPIQPMGASPNPPSGDEEKESVSEMLRYNNDLKPLHVVIFTRDSDFLMREEFTRYAAVEDYDSMADMVRESVARRAVRERMSEVVRKNKKTGKFILYAPNTGKKHTSKPVAEFSTKLAAKRAELAKFPPKDPEKLARLKKQVEKLLTDPKARAKEVMMKEVVSRDLFELALMSIVIGRDVKSCVLKEEWNFEDKPRQSGDEYQKFVKSFSKRAMNNDKDFQGEQENYKTAAEKALTSKAIEISKELGAEMKPLQAPKKHKDGKIYMPFSLTAKDQPELRPIFLYADGAKVKVRIGKEAKAALTTFTDANMADKVRSRLGNLNEEETPDDPNLAPAYGQMVDSTKGIYAFLDDFLSKLTPRAMAMLKQLWRTKYRKLGTA